MVTWYFDFQNSNGPVKGLWKQQHKKIIRVDWSPNYGGQFPLVESYLGRAERLQADKAIDAIPGDSNDSPVVA